jgi:alkylation response protein AidB-like acyl-CoA dehydrogenase
MDFDMTTRETGVKEALKALFKDRPGDLGWPLDPADQAYKERIIEWIRRLVAVGYMDMGVLEAKNSIALVAAQEELAAFSPALYLTAEISARLVGRIASRIEDRGILKAIISGEALGTAAFSEANTSYDQNPPSAAAQLLGDSYIIHGSKSWVANAAIADWVACFAGLGERRGIFLIRGNEKGLSIGPGMKGYGLEGLTFHPVAFNGASSMKQSSLLGEAGDSIAYTLKLWEDQILTSLSLGLMQRAYDEALGHAKAYHSGGKPIIAYQEVGFKLAEMLTLLQTARLLAYRAAWMDDTNQREAAMLCRCAKVFCAETAEQISSEAMQILGARAIFGSSDAASSHMASGYSKIMGTSVERSRVNIGDGVLETGC